VSISDGVFDKHAQDRSYGCTGQGTSRGRTRDPAFTMHPSARPTDRSSDNRANGSPRNSVRQAQVGR